MTPNPYLYKLEYNFEGTTDVLPGRSFWLFYFIHMMYILLINLLDHGDKDKACKIIRHKNP